MSSELGSIFIKNTAPDAILIVDMNNFLITLTILWPVNSFQSTFNSERVTSMAGVENLD
jgi:hypothetical protein